MTGRTWKNIVMEAVTTVSVNPWLMEEMNSPKQDTLEAMNVLQEVLPTLSEKRIERFLTELKEQGAEPTEKELQKTAVKLLKAKTDEEYEQLNAQILEMAMQQMQQVQLIDINPSYHCHD